MLDRMRLPRPGLGPLAVAGYAVSLAAAVSLLALVGDRVLAAALVVVELAVVAGIHWAVRAPRSPRREERVPGSPVLGLPGDGHADGSGRGVAVIAAALFGVIAAVALLVVVASRLG